MLAQAAQQGDIVHYATYLLSSRGSWALPTHPSMIGMKPIKVVADEGEQTTSSDSLSMPGS